MVKIKYFERYRESVFAHGFTNEKKNTSEMEIEYEFFFPKRPFCKTKLCLNTHNKILSLFKSLLRSIFLIHLVILKED